MQAVQNLVLSLVVCLTFSTTRIMHDGNTATWKWWFGHMVRSATRSRSHWWIREAQPARPLTQAGKLQPPLVQRLGADHIDVISPELLFSKLSEINVDDIIAEFSKVR